MNVIASAPSSRRKTPSLRWCCSLCSLEMHISHKDPHLVGKKHRQKQQEIAASNAQVEHRTGLAVVAPLPSSTLSPRTTHPFIGGSSLGIPSVKPSGNLPQALPKSGRRKRQRHPKPAPSANPPTRRDSDSDYDSEGLPTRRDSDSDYDSEDLRGILYDIDTAFGCCPQGGAYKESNYYSENGVVIY